MRIAVNLAFRNDGVRIESNRAIIAITTSSSIRVKAGHSLFGGRFRHHLKTHIVLDLGYIVTEFLFDGDTFSEVAGLVDIVASQYRGMIGQ